MAIQRVAAGTPITARHYNAVVDRVNKSLPIAGSGIAVKETANGSVISRRRPESNPAAADDAGAGAVENYLGVGIKDGALLLNNPQTDPGLYMFQTQKTADYPDGIDIVIAPVVQLALDGGYVAPGGSAA